MPEETDTKASKFSKGTNPGNGLRGLRSRRALRVCLCGVVAVFFLSSIRIEGQGGPRFNRETVNGREVVAREVLVKFRNRLPASELAQLAGDAVADEMRPVGRRGVLLLRSRAMNVPALLARLRNRPDVEYAEPNFILRIGATPNDAQFGQLWGLHNTGQVINFFFPGVPGADIDAVRAWDRSIGSTNHVVAVIDTGVDYTHPDLAANMWSAPAAFTVSVGGQSITCAAGTHGFNAITRTCNPMDDHRHGTHVAGTIGAVGNNGIGVTGVNWNARLMGIKFFDAAGNGTIADAIASIEFAIAAKQAFAATGAADIRVLSNSWGGPEFSQALLDEVIASNDADMLFVAGAGNNAFDNDILPFYPAGFDVPNVISVAATSNTDDLAWFSNYGAESVHLAAPGVNILSTVTGGGYAYMSGTSMAAPHVSGAAALVLSGCDMDTAALKETVIGTVTGLSPLQGVTITGGRLQVNSAMHACTLPPDAPSGLTARPADTQVLLAWNAPLGAITYNVKRSLAPGGPYVSIASDVIGPAYIDTDVVNGTRYYYVVSGQNLLGESGDSNEASAVPNIPSDLVVPSLTLPAVAAAGSTVTASVTMRNQGAGKADPSVTRFYWSVNSMLDATDERLVAVLPVPELMPGISSVLSVPIDIPAQAATGKYYVLASADDADALFESNEANNTRSRLISIGPDLDVSSLTVPSVGTAGGTISVTDKVTNAGGSSAPASSNVFYLSTNGTLGAGDILLTGSRPVPVLAAGAVSEGPTDLTIPSTTAVGSYYIIAKADGAETVVETSETNNTYARSIKIGGDLVISALTLTASGVSELVLSVNDTTTNEGSDSVGGSVTRFYLSSNGTLDAGDTPLEGGRVVSPLAPGISSQGITDVTIPAGTSAGLHYLIAKADADAAVPETSETNNTLAKSFYLGSDLVVSSMTVPSRGGAGTSITVDDTTSNAGGGGAAASFTRFYLSSNATWDSGDTYLTGGHSVPALAEGAEDVGSTTLILPADIATGTHYIIGRADADNAVLEAKETNNTISRSIQIGPDLDVSAFTVPGEGGAGLSFTVSDTTTNEGGGAIASTVMKFYLSANSSVDATDKVIGSRTVPGLAAGGFSNAPSTTLTIPANTAVGTHYVIARADADGAVTETSETNNTYSRTIKIGPDLRVSTLTASASSVAAGAVVTMTDKITNDGGGGSGTSVTRFFLSVNSTLDASDIAFTPGRSVPVIAPGGFSTGHTSLTIPAGTAPARYYILAKADGDNGTTETSETNNVLARSITVTGP
jgi:subtilisin family serine protease